MQENDAPAAGEEAPQKEWEYDGPESLTLQLLKPLKMHQKDENQVTSIVLFEPEVGHMSAYTVTENKTHDEFEAGAILISRNANVDVRLVRSMGSRDFKKALAFLMGFTTPPPKPKKDGESSSPT